MHTEENSRFAKTHEWAHMEGDIATVGISNHAQEEISDMVIIRKNNDTIYLKMDK